MRTEIIDAGNFDAGSPLIPTEGWVIGAVCFVVVFIVGAIVAAYGPRRVKRVAATVTAFVPCVALAVVVVALVASVLHTDSQTSRAAQVTWPKVAAVAGVDDHSSCYDRKAQVRPYGWCAREVLTGKRIRFVSGPWVTVTRDRHDDSGGRGGWLSGSGWVFRPGDNRLSVTVEDPSAGEVGYPGGSGAAVVLPMPVR